MGRDTSWFDDAAWDPRAQELFWRRLARARRNQGSSARTKAGRLWATGDPALRAEARRLLHEARARHGVGIEEQLVRFALDEGDLALAEAYYRREEPGYALAKVLVRAPDEARRREARALFAAHYEGEDCFGPWEEVADRVLDFDDFSTLAEALPGHYPGPEREWIRAALRVGAPDALEVLDRSMRVQAYYANFLGVITPHAARSLGTLDVLVERYLAALGAFLGEVLVRRFGGRWVHRKPAPRSTVRVGRRELDPFRHAYEVLFFEVLPGDLVVGLKPARQRQAKREA